MLIKAGVSIARLNRKIRKSLPVADRLYLQYGKELVITSTDDGNHGAGSLHYSNDAYDTRHPGTIEAGKIIERAKQELGPDYDILEESGDQPHLHWEYDKKTI